MPASAEERRRDPYFSVVDFIETLILNSTSSSVFRKKVIALGNRGLTPDFKWWGWSKDYFWQVSFWVAWFKLGYFGVFKTIWRFDFWCCYFSCFLEIFKALKFSMGFFGGCGEIPRNFCGFRFLPPFDHPRHLKSGVPPRNPPPPPRELGKFCNTTALQRHTALHVEWSPAQNEKMIRRGYISDALWPFNLGWKVAITT